LPVSGSSATTRLPAGKYITPWTTMGVTSLNVFAAGLLASGRNLYDQACVSFCTLPGLICVSGEKRVLARSRLYVGQSAAPAGFPVCAMRSGSSMAHSAVNGAIRIKPP